MLAAPRGQGKSCSITILPWPELEARTAFTRMQVMAGQPVRRIETLAQGRSRMRNKNYYNQKRATLLRERCSAFLYPNIGPRERRLIWRL